MSWDGSCFTSLTIEEEAEIYEELDIATTSTLYELFAEVPGSSTLLMDMCEVASAHYVSIHVVRSEDIASYHSAVSELESLYRSRVCSHIM